MRNGEKASLVVQSYLWEQDSRYLTLLPTKPWFPRSPERRIRLLEGTADRRDRQSPSEALALVSLPGAIIGGFVGGIATGAGARQAKTGVRTKDLTAQSDYPTAQTNYLAAQANLEKAKADKNSPK